MTLSPRKALELLSAPSQTARTTFFRLTTTHYRAMISFKSLPMIPIVILEAAPTTAIWLTMSSTPLVPDRAISISRTTNTLSSSQMAKTQKATKAISIKWMSLLLACALLEFEWFPSRSPNDALLQRKKIYKTYVLDGKSSSDGGTRHHPAVV